MLTGVINSQHGTELTGYAIHIHIMIPYVSYWGSHSQHGALLTLGSHSQHGALLTLGSHSQHGALLTGVIIHSMVIFFFFLQVLGEPLSTPPRATFGPWPPFWEALTY